MDVGNHNIPTEFHNIDIYNAFIVVISIDFFNTEISHQFVKVFLLTKVVKCNKKQYLRFSLITCLLIRNLELNNQLNIYKSTFL